MNAGQVICWFFFHFLTVYSQFTGSANHPLPPVKAISLISYNLRSLIGLNPLLMTFLSKDHELATNFPTDRTRLSQKTLGFIDLSGNTLSPFIVSSNEPRPMVSPSVERRLSWASLKLRSLDTFALMKDVSPTHLELRLSRSGRFLQTSPRFALSWEHVGSYGSLSKTTLSRPDLSSNSLGRMSPLRSVTLSFRPSRI